MEDRADGIRTRGLELMRLARTTAPLPRKVWLAGLEPAIPGFRGRWGGQLPHSQMATATMRSGSTNGVVGGPGLFPRLLVIPSFDHEGLGGSGGRDRTCDLAGNNRASSQLDHTGTGQAEAAGLEPASGWWPPTR
jgi:hypothetical protein